MMRRELAYFFLALGYFTRLPVPAWVDYSPAALAASARYFPAVGLVVGGIAALVYLLASLLWPPMVAVLLAMASSLYVTGAFHEDGLSDTADGLGGGWEKARILEIMKDSRVGSYGVVALWGALTLKATVLFSLAPSLIVPALLAGHAASRFCAMLLLFGMDYARDEGASKARPLAQRPATGGLFFALLFVAASFAALPPMAWGLGSVLGLLVTLWLARKFQRWLGGYTGDCLGAVQQLAEIAFYLGVLAQVRG